MMLTAELELAILISALYLQDTALLLHSNEGVLTSTGKGGWKLGLGAAQTRIMGKSLYMPNPLTLHRPHYRMRWDFEDDKNQIENGDLHSAEPSSSKTGQSKSDGRKRGQNNPGTLQNASISNWMPHLEAFDRLGWLTLIVGLLQLAAFPAAMFTYQTDVSVMAVLLAIYASIIVTLWVVWTKSVVFGLTGKKFVVLCFECIVCPPLAINLVRRFSLDMCKSADLVEVAGKLLEPEAWSSAQQELGSQIEDQMSLEPEDSPRYTAMQARLELLSPKRSNDDDHQ